PENFHSLLGTLALVMIVILSIGAVINARNVVIKTVDLSSEKLDKELRIVSAPDLHLGPINREEYLKDRVAQINSLNPDLVLIPGDLLDGPGKLSDELLKPINEIKAQVYFTYGNHEQYVGGGIVEKLIGNTKIITLRDNATTVKGIQIIGLDDAENKSKVKETLPGIKKQEGYRILMYHRPDGFKDADVDLMLSGHTHGGQIWPFNYLVKIRFSLIKGLYLDGNKALYVSPGVGTWGPPMRLGSQSEITLIRVSPQ
ncbi:metallophosphoesterase, partial [Candidatus Woesearchaeota archaeon]|nr:metallophosphoesterase [Candidatus Woesearchaeota archaeon]